MIVYIIQSDWGLGFPLENRCATLDKEEAKRIIKEEIFDNADEISDEEYVDKFAQDLVDGNTENHYCDEFDGLSIWCDRLPLREE